MIGFSPRVSPYGLPLILAGAALLLVYGRFVAQAGSSVNAARAARDRGDQVEATRAYLDALRFYVPGNPFERQALDGLAALAATAHASGDSAGERRAWNAVRVGLLGTRSFFMPFPTRFAEANQHLAGLDATATFPAPRTPLDLAVVSVRGNGPGRSVRPLGPAVMSTLIALIGFACWTGSIALLIRRGLERDPRRRSTPVPATRVLLPLLFVAGFALFLVGLRFS